MADNKDTLNLDGFLKQIVDLKNQVTETQKNVAHVTAEGVSGAGDDLVRVVMSGFHYVKKISLTEALLKKSPELVGDLIAAAVNDAVRKVEKAVKAKIGGMMSAVGITDDMNDVSGE